MIIAKVRAYIVTEKIYKIQNIHYKVWQLPPEYNVSLCN